MFGPTKDPHLKEDGETLVDVSGRRPPNEQAATKAQFASYNGTAPIEASSTVA